MIIRNLDLTRQLLLQAEKCAQLDARDPNVSYHIHALRGTGLLEASVSRTANDFHNGMVVMRLTHKGQEFLGLAKDDCVWQRTKHNFTKPGIFFSLENIFDYLKRTAVCYRNGVAAA